MKRYDHSIGQVHWQTPPKLYAQLDKEFNFTLDPCPRYPTQDGLIRHWSGNVFVNPPYGRGLVDWFRKAFKERAHCNVIVFLIPARTDPKWWHDYVMKANQIRLTKDRVHFVDPNTHKPRRAPFGAAIVVFYTRLGKTKFSSYVLPKEDTK